MKSALNEWWLFLYKGVNEMGKIEYNKDNILFRGDDGSTMAYIHFDNDGNLVFKEVYPDKIKHEVSSVENKITGGTITGNNVKIDEEGITIKVDENATRIAESAYRMAVEANEKIGALVGESSTLSQMIDNLQMQIDELNGRIN